MSVGRPEHQSARMSWQAVCAESAKMGSHANMVFLPNMLEDLQRSRISVKDGCPYCSRVTVIRVPLTQLCLYDVCRGWARPGSAATRSPTSDQDRPREVGTTMQPRMLSERTSILTRR